MICFSDEDVVNKSIYVIILRCIVLFWVDHLTSAKAYLARTEID